MAVDGSLIFNTKIDTQGYEKGVSELSSKTVGLKNKIEDTTKQITSLKKELQDMSNTQIKSDVAVALEKKVEKAKSKLNELYAQADNIGNGVQSSLSDMGFDNKYLDSMLEQNVEWQKIQAEITKAENELNNYQIELSNVNAAESKVTGKDTAEYKNKQQKINALKGQLSVYTAKLRESESAENNAAKQTIQSSKNYKGLSTTLKKVGGSLKSFIKILKNVAGHIKNVFGTSVSNAIKRIGSNTSKTNAEMGLLSKSLKRIKQALAGMLIYKILQGGLQALKDGINNLAQASPKLNSNLSVLLSSLTYLKNSLGAAFAPIINIITPVLSKFMDVLSSVTDKVAQFFAALTGNNTYTKAVKVQQDYAKSIADTTKATTSNTKALENNKQSLAGYDELNVMQDNSTVTTPDTTAATITPNDMFDTASVSKQISGFAKTVKDLLNRQSFGGIGEIIADKINNAMAKINWSKIRATSALLATNIADLLNAALKKLNWYLVGTTIGNGLMIAVDFAYKLITKFNWAGFGIALAMSLNGVISSINFATMSKTISNLVTGIFTSLSLLISTLDWQSLSNKVITLLKNIKWSNISAVVINLLSSLQKAIAKTNFKGIGAAIRSGFGKINFKGIWGGLISVTTNAIKGISDLFGLKGISTSTLKNALKSLSTSISNIFGTIKNTISQLIVPIINDFLPVLINLIGDIIDGISPIIKSLTPISKTVINLVTSITKSLSPILTTIGNTIAKIVDAMTPIFEPVANLISSVVQTLAPVIDAIFGVLGGIAQIVGGLLSPVGQIIDELVGNGEPTISAKLQGELDNLSQVSDDLQTVGDNIDTVINGVDDNLNSTSGDLQYVEDLKDKMVELLSKSTLSEDDMTNLNTIADLISEKYPDFKNTWDNMVNTDTSGNKTLKKNIRETISAIEGVISKLKEQYATEALQDEYKDMYKQQIETNKAVAESQNKVNDAKKVLSEKSDAYNTAVSEQNELIKKSKGHYNDYAMQLENAQKKVDSARNEGIKYQNALRDTQSELNKTKGKQAELNTKMESVEGIMQVVSGSVKSAKGNYQKLRDAYDAGFIDDKQLKSKFKVSADEIYKGTKNVAEMSKKGYNEGILKESGYDKAGQIFASKILESTQNDFGVHSPSTKFRDIAQYCVRGYVNVFKNDNTAVNTAKSFANRIINAIRTVITKTNYAGMVLNIWGTVKPALNTILSGFESFFNRINNGLNQVINNLNTVGKNKYNQSGVKFVLQSNVPNVKIPRLATGTVVPANYGEFLATLGDNKREPEIVSPLSTMKQALAEALAENGGAGGGDINLTIELDGDVIAKKTVKWNDSYKKSHGSSAFA